MSEDIFVIESFFERRALNGKMVTVAICPMIKEVTRTAYPYRPYSKYAESYFGGNHLYDDVCMLLNGEAVRCKMCQAPTIRRFLIEGVCPDCDGRSEWNGTDPHSIH